LLEELTQPLLSTTLILPPDETPLSDPDLIRERLERQIELIIDGGACSLEPTSVVDLSDGEPQLLRQGRGNVGMFGL
jgi:tRNA A37 threonylcarbamoyladenosine synthetase subunit TsaC/SUA5/YrdC